MLAKVLHCSTTIAIWNDLKERFEQHNGPLIFQLKRDFSHLTTRFHVYFFILYTILCFL
uniref:Retrotransposon gag domain-containing protein n=1 Tax=Cajanus cajan TaxID=3821 RepID=A0A151S034_CAJCA|nr:hypothetical protein KK1_030133 [Cajanus cajan]